MVLKCTSFVGACLLPRLKAIRAAWVRGSAGGARNTRPLVAEEAWTRALLAVATLKAAMPRRPTIVASAVVRLLAMDTQRPRLLLQVKYREPQLGLDLEQVGDRS